MMSFYGELQLRGGDGDGGLAGVDGVLLGPLVVEVDDAVIGVIFFNTIHTFPYNLLCTRDVNGQIPVTPLFCLFL